jgi:hypothetical protein
LTIYEKSLCPDCGTPAAWAFNPRLERYFYEDDSVTCTACKIRETRAADQHDKLRPGEKIVIGNLLVEPELLEASGR